MLAAEWKVGSELTAWQGTDINVCAFIDVWFAAPPRAVDDVFPQPLTGPTSFSLQDILRNDSVPCGSKAVVRIAEDPSFGTITAQGDQITYNPSLAQNVFDSFKYSIECEGVPVSHSSMLHL